MSKALVLAEKPSVGRDLARVLACRRKRNGYFEGDRHVVTWALGHLVTLAEPDSYDARYQQWRLEDLPMLPDRLKLEVIRGSSRQYKIVRELMNRKDIGEIVIATDAGREGELVARWIIEKAGVRKELKRLWISSVTDKAIREGFARLRPGREYENLYAAAQARAEADWFVGINATRALTCKYNAQLSCGRVQTPTLAIIARREEEINNFRPKTFYGIAAQTDALRLTWQDAKSGEIRLFDKDRCDALLRSLRSKDAVVSEVARTAKKSMPPQLYDLTELQRDANRRFGYSARETLAIMQSLYERHKVLTYPRTDSRYLSADIVETLPERVKAVAFVPYARFAARILRSPIRGNGHFVDNAKVSDHHAIIPTEETPLLSRLDEGEKRIYDLVVRRFLAVLYPPCEYEQTIVRVIIGGETFVAKGKIIKAPGWKEVYGTDEDEAEADGDGVAEQMLPDIAKGDVLTVTQLVLTRGETRPPAPFNEATLLSAMENPAKYMNDKNKALNTALEEAGGLGTVATRADIIEKLFNTFLMEKHGKDIFLTGKGKQLLELVPEEMKSPALTARWEQKLDAIRRGETAKKDFILEIRDYTRSVVSEIKSATAVFRHDNLTRTRCPECGKYLLEVKGKRGKMLVCQDRECGYRQHLSAQTNARCPNCHKKMDLHGEGEGRIFVCRCGYREKLSAFEARRKHEMSGVSKKDAHKYLREQAKENKPTNTALADALAKLKLK